MHINNDFATSQIAGGFSGKTRELYAPYRTNTKLLNKTHLSVSALVAC